MPPSTMSRVDTCRCRRSVLRATSTRPATAHAKVPSIAAYPPIGSSSAASPAYASTMPAAGYSPDGADAAARALERLDSCSYDNDMLVVLRPDAEQKPNQASLGPRRFSGLSGAFGLAFGGVAAR